MNVHDLDIELFEPDIVEWRHRREYEVDGREVILTGKVDAIAGLRVIDYKSTHKAIDLSRYHDSMQWRAYLALHQRCNLFRYEVLQFGRTRAKRGQPAQSILVGHRHLELYRYTGLEEDVYAAIVQYTRFCYRWRTRGWFGSAGRTTEATEY